MKRVITLFLTLALAMTAFAGCSSAPAASSAAPAASSEAASSGEASKEAEPAAPSSAPTELTVITSYGGDDGNRKNYEDAFKAFEQATGNTVKDASGTATEEWKAKVMANFETGAEPDVLFWFNGIDSNTLVEGGKVVSIDEIRKVYPDYATNMKDELMGASPVDGKNYSVPVNGYWEGLFVNKKVLADCGVEVPDATTTWDQFLKDCETIKSKGYTPIAVSLQEVPNYWFEYVVLNHTTVAKHTTLPVNSSDEQGKAWVAGLNDLKTMYEKGYFPKNTTTATDGETFQLMADDKAAFAIDGSWKVGWFQENAKNIDDFTVTYVPAQGERKNTDIIGGLSMGYFITEKAWNNPEKQKACVDFVMAMTTDEVVSKFASTSITALKNGVIPPENADSLMKAAIEMTKGATGIAPATQDGMNPTGRAALFADIKNIAAGSKTAEEVLDTVMQMKD